MHKGCFGLIWFVSFKTESYPVAQDDLGFLILLPQPSKCWVYRCMSLIRQVGFGFFIFLGVKMIRIASPPQFLDHPRAVASMRL